MAAKPLSLQNRLFWCLALVTVTAALLPFFISRGSLYEKRLELARQQTLAQLQFTRTLFESGLPDEQVRHLFDSTKAMGMRLTLIDARGVVLQDSTFSGADTAGLDNHSDRPEVSDARCFGKGFSLRYSVTLGYDVLYTSVRMRDGTILRIGLPLAHVHQTVETELSSLSYVIAGVIGLCLLLSMLMARKVRQDLSNMTTVVESISLGDYQRRLYEVPGREFLPLAGAVNRMAEHIEIYVQTTSDQQAQLEVILDSMHEGVLVLDPAGRIRRCNKAMAKLFPEVLTATGRQIIEAIPVPLVQRRIEDLLRRGPEQGGRAMEALHFELPLGRFLVAHLSLPVTPDAQLGAVAVFYDATEIMRLERVRRDFVANVSHELRTPLTSVTGYAETLMNLEDLSDEHRHFAEVIHKHGVFLARVVDDLLALARIENTREKISLAPADARMAVEEAIQFCRDTVSEKSLQFVLRVEKGTTVLSNGPLLTQIFRNLFENACRYSPENGVIRVTARRCTAGRTAGSRSFSSPPSGGRASGSTVSASASSGPATAESLPSTAAVSAAPEEYSDMLFIVTDNGPGIPKAELPRIFERFYQVQRQRNSATSGIGLAICKHIIERHGGRIWAESPYEDASTAMLFTLPLAGPEEKPAKSPLAGRKPEQSGMVT